jgi:hypothetical protein
MRVNLYPNGKVPVMTRCCHGKTGRATVEPGYIEVTGNNAPVRAGNVPDISDKYGYTTMIDGGVTTSCRYRKFKEQEYINLKCYFGSFC